MTTTPQPKTETLEAQLQPVVAVEVEVVEALAATTTPEDAQKTILEGEYFQS